jgi:hypothetical protein
LILSIKIIIKITQIIIPQINLKIHNIHLHHHNSVKLALKMDKLVDAIEDTAAKKIIIIIIILQSLKMTMTQFLLFNLTILLNGQKKMKTKPNTNLLFTILNGL